MEDNSQLENDSGSNTQNNNINSSQNENNVDTKNLNENNLQVLQDEVSNYWTDSDIDDPKYLPTSSLPNKNSNNIGIYKTLGSSSTVQNRAIQYVKNDATNIIQKNLQELENENNLLRHELVKRQENLNTKDTVLLEFQNWTEMSKQKFKQFEENILNLKQQNEKLIQQCNAYENDIKNERLKAEKHSSNTKNIEMYQEHIKEMQTEYSEKEEKLQEKYKNSEKNIKSEFLEEISKITKEKDDLKIENEKLKFQISNGTIEMEKLSTIIDDKEYEHKLELSKNEREKNNWIEKIKELEEKLWTDESYNKKELIKKEEEINSIKETNTTIVTESNLKNSKILELENQIEDFSRNIDTISNDLKEYKQALQNKDSIIVQLKGHTDELTREWNSRDKEWELKDISKQNEYKEFTEQFNAIIQEKNEIEAQNAEWVESLSVANESLKKLNDLITDKYASMEVNLYKEISKNDNWDKKYKGVIKQLKLKEKSILEENKSLKDLVNERDIEKEQMEFQYQNEIKNASLYNMSGNNYNNNMVNNSMSLNNWNVNNMNSSNMIYSSGVMNRSGSNLGMNVNATSNMNININRFDDPKEEGQKRALEEFKKLLNKIDEKLDLPIKNI